MTKDFQIFSQPIRRWTHNPEDEAAVCFAHYFKALDTWTWILDIWWFCDQTSFGWLVPQNAGINYYLGISFFFFLIGNIVMEGIITLSRCFKSWAPGSLCSSLADLAWSGLMGDQLLVLAINLLHHLGKCNCKPLFHFFQEFMINLAGTLNSTIN